MMELPTDEELRAEANKWSFTLQEFLDYMNPASDWERVIRAHIYADFVLQRCIEESLDIKDVFETDRLNFPSKLRLACALGTVARELVGPFEALNKIRNSLVHRMDSPLSEKHRQDLMNSLPDQIMCSAVGLTNEKNSGPSLEANIKCILITLVVALEVGRKKQKYARLDLQTLMVRVWQSLSPENQAKIPPPLPPTIGD